MLVLPVGEWRTWLDSTTYLDISTCKVATGHRPAVQGWVLRLRPLYVSSGAAQRDKDDVIGLRDSLDRAITDALEEHLTAHRALTTGLDEGRGHAADAVQGLQAARNALLDAASRWDNAS